MLAALFCLVRSSVSVRPAAPSGWLFSLLGWSRAVPELCTVFCGAARPLDPSILFRFLARSLICGWLCCFVPEKKLKLL